MAKRARKPIPPRPICGPPARRSNNGRQFWYDKAAADRAVNFFPLFLRHVDGKLKGQPIRLPRWLEAITREAFGWKRGIPGMPRSRWPRQYQVVYIEVPKKNTKSTYASGIALYLLHCDREPRAEIYSLAASREQARIVFDRADLMVKASPQLRRRTDCFRNSLYVPRTASIYKVLSAEAPTAEGVNPHGTIFDEFHAQPNDKLWNVFSSADVSREQPITLIITTAGDNRNSICYTLHEHALKVSQGIVPDDSFLGIIYAAQEPEPGKKGDDWKDEKTWAKANPNLGISVKVENLRQKLARALTNPALEASFKRYHLNIWTEQAVRYIPMAKWDACKAPVPIEELKLAACFAGLDLSSTTDLAAWLLLFPADENRPFYDILCRFWVPEENLRLRAERDRVPYPEWVERGLIEATPGDSIDYDIIEQRIEEDAQRFAIQEIAVDPWNAQQMMTRLDSRGHVVVPFRQGWKSMSPPTKALLPLVLKILMRHGGNEVLRWCASNLAVVMDPAENLKPAKDKSRDRIDGMVALIMALGRAQLYLQPETEVILV